MITGIIKGHMNEWLGKEDELSAERMKICNACPLLASKQIGNVCNASLWLNPETNETSTTQKEGFKKGCGCRLAAKTRVPDSHCPTGKW